MAAAVLRVALAVREADGKPLVDDTVLDILPRFAGAAAEILRRAGFLDAACARAPGPRGIRHYVGLGPRSCQTCGAWGTRRRRDMITMRASGVSARVSLRYLDR